MTRYVLLVFLAFLVCCSEKTSMHNEQDSISSLSKELLANPKDTSLLLKRKKLFLSQGNLEKAILDQQLLFKLDSSNLKYRYGLAEMYFKLSDSNPNYIINSFDLLSENLMVYSPALLLRGKLNYIFQNYDISLKDINAYLPSNPYDASAYFYKGLIYKETGNFEMAKSQFQTTVEQDPSFVEAYEQLAFIFDIEGDPIAEFYFDNAISVDSSNLSSWYNKGMYHQSRGEFIKSKMAYNGLLRQDSLHSDSHFNLGYIALLEKEFEVAVFHFGVVIQQRPDFATAYFSRGLAFKNNNSYKQAKDDFKMALELNPQLNEAEKELKNLP